MRGILCVNLASDGEAKEGRQKYGASSQPELLVSRLQPTIGYLGERSSVHNGLQATAGLPGRKLVLTCTGHARERVAACCSQGGCAGGRLRSTAEHARELVAVVAWLSQEDWLDFSAAGAMVPKSLLGGAVARPELKAQGLFEEAKPSTSRIHVFQDTRNHAYTEHAHRVNQKRSWPRSLARNPPEKLRRSMQICREVRTLMFWNGAALRPRTGLVPKARSHSFEPRKLLVIALRRR